MMTGMFWASLLILFIVLGFALIVWSVAGKENGAVKTGGQIIAIVIAVLVLILFLYGSISGGKMKGMCGMCAMGKTCKMHSSDKAKMMMQDKSTKTDEKGMKSKVKDNK